MTYLMAKPSKKRPKNFLKASYTFNVLKVVKICCVSSVQILHILPTQSWSGQKRFIMSIFGSYCKQNTGM